MKFLECGEKKQYKSKSEAKISMKTMDRYHRNDGRLHVYFCRYCKYWHIGNHRMKTYRH